MALAAAGVIPIDCDSYNVVWRYLMPLAASLFLLETDFSRLLQEGGGLLSCFLVGSVGMLAGAVLAYRLLQPQLGPEGSKLAACLCASYVGGSVNFAAVAQAVALPAAAVPAAMAADNLAMALCLAVVMAVPVPAGDAGSGGGSGSGAEASRNSSGDGCSPSGSSGGSGGMPNEAPFTAQSAALSFGVGALACAVGQALAIQFGAASMQLLITAGVAAALSAAVRALLPADAAPPPPPQRSSLQQAAAAPSADAAATSQQAAPGVTPNSALPGAQPGNAAPQAQHQAQPPPSPQAQPAPQLQPSQAVHNPFAGASHLGVTLMMLFFAVIGASAGSLSSLASCGWLVVFVVLMCAVHWAFMSGYYLVAKPPLRVLLLGSNAAVGGPATTAAMAASRGWRDLLQPAVLTATLGYVVGTAAGLLVARFTGAA